MKPTLAPDPKIALQATPLPVSPVAKDKELTNEIVEPPVTIKEEVVEADEDLEGELTCNVCELTVEGFMEMETHAATHTVTDTNVSQVRYQTIRDSCFSLKMLPSRLFNLI